MADTAAGHTRFERQRSRDRADTSGAVPRRRWKDVAVRTWKAMKRDNVPLLAAGVAFFGLLALVPSLVAFVSTYGLVADPDEVQTNVDDALAAAPTEVRDLVESQLSSIVESEPSGLQLGALIGLVVALWSASAGMKHLVSAVNQAYGEEEGRGFVRLRGLALGLTIGAIVLLAVTAALLLVLPRTLDGSGSEGALRDAVMIVRWPVFAVLAMVGLSILYRLAPDRPGSRWRWMSPGAVFATVGWLLASVGFAIYTANFGNYNETYGALGAIIVVMLWLYITAYVVIAGAELNSELEKSQAA
jgi:membrane protein